MVAASGISFSVSDVIFALIILVLTYLISKLIVRIGSRPLKRVSLQDYVKTWILRIIKWLVWLTGILVALSILGIDVTTLVLGLGLITLIIGVAMSTWVENLVAGVMVQAEKEVWVGDKITILKWQIVEGTVIKLNIRTTVIKTKEGNIAFIPNKLFMDTPILVKKGPRKPTVKEKQ